jgi:hypothetical protein
MGAARRFAASGRGRALCEVRRGNLGGHQSDEISNGRHDITHVCVACLARIAKRRAGKTVVEPMSSVSGGLQQSVGLSLSYR